MSSKKRLLEAQEELRVTVEAASGVLQELACLVDGGGFWVECETGIERAERLAELSQRMAVKWAGVLGIVHSELVSR
jgi:hypothetical protein